MVMNGVGLGYQIDELLSKIDVNYLFINEPNTDVFFSSLHTMDYSKLFGYFNRSNWGLNLLVGVSKEESAFAATKYMVNIGVYNCVRRYEFDHLVGADYAKGYQGMIQGIEDSAASLSFFDDERVGVVQSCYNFSQNYPVFCNHEFTTDVPVIICANGPSLDQNKDFLHQVKDKAIICTAGSTLGALYKMGIKPDFHVENERVKSILSWVKSSSDPEFRQDVQLLALNVVYPQVYKEFGKVSTFLKTNDLGTNYFVHRTGDNHKFPDITHCNPTVSNTACSIFVNMGFKNIFLLGVDLGFAPSGQHHSSFSQYGDVDKEVFKTNKNLDHKAAGHLKVKGNFYKEITTTKNFS